MSGFHSFFGRSGLRAVSRGESAVSRPTAGGVDAGHGAWAERLLGAGWLIGATVLGLLHGVDFDRPVSTLVIATAGLFGLTLIVGLVHTGARGRFDALLFASTSTWA